MFVGLPPSCGCQRFFLLLGVLSVGVLARMERSITAGKWLFPELCLMPLRTMAYQIKQAGRSVLQTRWLEVAIGTMSYITK